MQNDKNIQMKVRNIMLGGLYELGDPKKQASLLDAWKLSK